MGQKISTIKKVGLKKEDMHSMIMLDTTLSGNDLKFLEDEFDIYKEDLDKFLANYRNIGIVFKLKPIQVELSKDWERFVSRVVKRGNEFNKFNNIFIGDKYDKALLITNKRLLKIDLENLNEKIEEANYRIEDYDEKIEAETKEFEKETQEPKGFLNKLIAALKR